MAGKSNDSADLFALGKQFWDTWSGFAQQSLGGSAPAWSNPAEVFAKVAPDSLSDAAHATESMAEQGRQFLEFLQAAASRMGASQPLDAAGVAELWRGTLGDGNPLMDALRAVNSEGARGFEQAGRDLLELLEPMRQSIAAQLDLPAFGYSRERQQHWQALQQAAGEHARAQAAYNALLLKASQRGMEYFENKLVERSEPGRQLDSARAVYDLWVDAAEEAYAEVAMSPEFRGAYAALVDTQMRLRQRMQAEVEHHAAQLGMPTRSELDGTHRKILQLGRELRELRAALADGQAARQSAPTTTTGGRAGSATAARAAAGKSAKAGKANARNAKVSTAKASKAKTGKAKASKAAGVKRDTQSAGKRAQSGGRARRSR